MQFYNQLKKNFINDYFHCDHDVKEIILLFLLTGLLSCQEVDVKVATSGQTLCQDYYEACVNPVLVQPIFVAELTTDVTCSAAGCHNVRSGSGGALKLFPNAIPGSQDITANFFSAKSFTNISDPAMSKLLLEPLAGTFSIVGSHTGGNIFPGPSSPQYQELFYWISHPQSIATESCPNLDQFPDDPGLRCIADGNN